MRRRATIRRATTVALSLLFVSIISSAQVRFVGDMIQEKVAKRGEKYNVNFSIINPTENDIELMITQKDIETIGEKILFKEIGTNSRSNGGWILMRYRRLILPKKKQANLKFEIQVPKLIEAGSYFSLLMVRIQPKTVQSETISASVGIQYAIQVISTISGGRKEIQITDVRTEKNDLILTLQNTGDEFIRLWIKPDNRKIERLAVKIYPSMEREVKLDISNLADGVHKERVIFDDLSSYLRAEVITFRKGEPPPPPERLKGTKLRKTTGKPYNLFMNLNFGSIQKGISLSGRVNFWKLSFQANSNYNQVFYNEFEHDFSGHRLTANFRNKHFFMGMGSYVFINDQYSRWSTMFRTGMNFKSTHVAISYLKEHRLINLNISQRIFKKYYLKFYGFKSPYRTDWNFSLMIPLL